MKPIVSRRFIRPSNLDEDVVLCVYEPAFDGGAWSCQYHIKGNGFDRIANAFGEDSMQALLISFGMAAADLYTSDAWKRGDLLWIDQRDLHLPIPDGYRPELGEGWKA